MFAGVKDDDATFTSFLGEKLKMEDKKEGENRRCIEVHLENLPTPLLNSKGYHQMTPRTLKQLQFSVFLFVLLLLILNTNLADPVNAYADLNPDLDPNSQQQQQPNSHYSQLLPSLSSSADFSSVPDDTSNSFVTLRSNLSCYVCMTVDDMRCKFINETNRHIFQQMLESGEDNGGLVTGNGVRVANGGGYNGGFTVGEQKELQSLISSYGSIHTGDSSGNGNSRGRPLVMTTSGSGSSSEVLDSDAMGVEYNSLTPSETAHRIFGAECLPDEHYCAVHRMGVSPFKQEHSHEFNFFALIRSCTKTCNPGCFIIGNGERTKLSFCVSCCTSNYCNYGNAAVGINGRPLAMTIITALIAVLVIASKRL